MADDQQAQEVVENVTQPEAMPTSEQNTTEVEGSNEDQIASQDTDTEGSLPEGTSQRTSDQFEKLKAQLAQEREMRTRLERRLPPVQTQAPTTPSWYDPTSGQVDVNKLQAVEAEREQKIANLERQLQGVSQKDEAEQEAEAYKTYPELDPKSKKYDTDFQEQVVNSLAVAYAKGLNPSYKQAADQVMRIAERVAKKAEQMGAQKAMEQLSPKEQAALEATGRSDRKPTIDREALRRQTRSGGQNASLAIMERLGQIKSVGT